MTRDVLGLLRAAREPWTIRDLANVGGVPRRVMEEWIEEQRLSGVPIIGDAHGLHLARDSQELADYLEARRRRLVSQYKGTRALRPTLARMRAAERDDDAENRAWMRHWKGAA